MLNARYLNDGQPQMLLNETQKEYLSVFRSKSQAGEYQMESYRCECGNAENFELLAQKDRYGLPVSTVICPCCGLVMTNPRMTSESYDRFYETEYPFIYRALQKPDDDYFNNKITIGNAIVDFVEKNTIPPGKNMLEIGCAGGGIVKAFQGRGYNAQGVDLSPVYVGFGQRKGVNLRCCHSAELLKESKLYDIIVINHVLEHFTDLANELDTVRRLLNPNGGILYIAVPGIKHLLFSYKNDFLLFLQNAHVYHFTKDTLAQIMKWHGFDALCVNEKVEGCFCVGQKEKSVTNYYEDIKGFLEELEEHRENVFPMQCRRIQSILQNYGENEVAIYGTGKEADKMMQELGEHTQIKGFLTKDIIESGEYYGYPVLDTDDLQGVKCIVIAAKVYKNVIYERIQYLEKQGIEMVQLYE